MYSEHYFKTVAVNDPDFLEKAADMLKSSYSVEETADLLFSIQKAYKKAVKALELEPPLLVLMTRVKVEESDFQLWGEETGYYARFTNRLFVDIKSASVTEDLLYHLRRGWHAQKDKELSYDYYDLRREAAWFSKEYAKKWFDVDTKPAALG